MSSARGPLTRRPQHPSRNVDIRQKKMSPFSVRLRVPRYLGEERKRAYLRETKRGLAGHCRGNSKNASLCRSNNCFLILLDSPIVSTRQVISESQAHANHQGVRLKTKSPLKL